MMAPLSRGLSNFMSSGGAAGQVRKSGRPLELNAVNKRNLIFIVKRVVNFIEGRCGLDELPLTARAILNVVAEAHFEGQALRVTDITGIWNFSSPPTVYSHLSRLEHAGWIKYVEDQNDRRAEL
jgi:hypothetical protein